MRYLFAVPTAALMAGSFAPLLAQRAPTIVLTPATVSTAPEFNRVSSIRELADGSLLVADKGDRRLLHVTFDGSEPRLVGRLGNGPGEYRSVGWLYPLAGDTTLFTDGFHSRWNILDGARLVSSFSEGRERNRRFGPDLAGTDARGHVLALIGHGYAPGVPHLRTSAESILVVLSDLDSGGEQVIARIRGRGGLGFAVSSGNGGVGRIMAANPLGSEEQALLLPDGWVAIAYLEPYRVDWRDPAGRWVRGRELSMERTDVDQREKCFALSRMIPKAPCDPAMAPGWPARVPAFLPWTLLPSGHALLADPSGRLLIARTPTAARPESRYDLIDRDAHLVGTLTLPPSEWVAGFGRASVYTVSVTDDGLQTIRRHPWR